MVNKKFISHLVIKKYYTFELGTASLAVALGCSNGDNVLSKLHMLYRIYMQK